MSTTETIEKEQFDESLQEELDQLEYYAHGDYVEIEVTEVERLSEDEVRITFNPPAGAEFSRKMRIPVDPSYDTEFTRLLDSAGFNYSTASNIVGERVPFRYTDDGWEHVYTPYDGILEHTRHRLDNIDVRDMFWAIGVGGGLVLFPICGLFLFVEASEDGGHDYFDAAFAYSMGTMLWLLMATFAL